MEICFRIFLQDGISVTNGLQVVLAATTCMAPNFEETTTELLMVDCTENIKVLVETSVQELTWYSSGMPILRFHASSPNRGSAMDGIVHSVVLVAPILLAIWSSDPVAMVVLQGSMAKIGGPIVTTVKVVAIGKEEVPVHSVVTILVDAYPLIIS